MTFSSSSSVAILIEVNNKWSANKTAQPLTSVAGRNNAMVMKVDGTRRGPNGLKMGLVSAKIAAPAPELKLAQLQKTHNTPRLGIY